MEDGHAGEGISAQQFLLKTLLWLPACFAAWYGLAGLFSFPAIWLSDLLLPLALPSVIDGVEQQGYWVDIITQLKVQATNDQTGQFVFSFNALKYGYGFPLLLAMMLATPYSPYEKLDDITYGLLVVVLAQTWGIVFEALSSLLLKADIGVATQAHALLPWTQGDIFLNLVALGYQLGFLILPAVVPIAFWIMRHQGLLERLARR